MRSLSMFGSGILLVAVAINFQNCGKFGAVDLAKKEAFLSKARVFSRATGLRDCRALNAIQVENDMDCAPSDLLTAGAAINGTPQGGGTGTQIGGNPAGGATGTQVGGSPSGGGTGTQVGGGRAPASELSGVGENTIVGSSSMTGTNTGGNTGMGGMTPGGSDSNPGGMTNNGSMTNNGGTSTDNGGTSTNNGGGTNNGGMSTNGGTSTAGGGNMTGGVLPPGAMTNGGASGSGSETGSGASGSSNMTGGNGIPSGGETSGSGSTAGMSGGTDGGMTGGSPGGMTPVAMATPAPVADYSPEFPVRYLCSDLYAAGSNNFVLKGLNEELKIVFLTLPDQNTFNGYGTKVCEYSDPTVLSNLRDRKTVVLPSLKRRCPNLVPGQYKLAIVGKNQNDTFQTNLLYNEQQINVLPQPGFVTQAWGQSIANQYMMTMEVSNRTDGTLEAIPLPMATNVPMILYDRNGFAGGDQANCDNSVSPLVIQLSSGKSLARRLELTPQFQGVLFDILGKNSFPAPFTKKQISWLNKTSSTDHYFLTLPDAQGKVSGINQLFGDNTTGPDGKFAMNGYLALAKWDGRRTDGTIDSSAKDGTITSSDEVFSSLRLWGDKNSNGVVDEGELHTLAEMNVDLIDLNFDPTYSELDRYGNTIKMKSIARTTDGDYHVMYDIWFKIKK